MDEKGVYAIARAIWDNPDFADDEYTQREAWMWLIGAAAWKEIRIRGNGGSVILKRGEFAFSVRFLAERFKWSKSRVERFISALKNRDSIRDTSRDGSTVYFITKYNDFQVVGLKKRDSTRDAERDTSGTAAGHERDKEETLQTLEALEDNKRAERAAALAAFPLFWSQCPRKAGKGQAEKAWRKAVKLATPAILIAGMQRYALSQRDTEPQFIKHPATWLNGKCWEDEGGGAQIVRLSTAFTSQEEQEAQRLARERAYGTAKN